MSTSTSDPTPSLPSPILTLPTCQIRPYHASDVDAVARYANNTNVARRLRPHFPSPYTRADAESWVQHCTSETGTTPTHFVIADPVTGEFYGSIGIRPMGSGDESRTAELGYWLGEPFWGRGIMSDAAAAFARWALEEGYTSQNLLRLEAHIYATNQASRAVVTKAGFVLEGTRRKAGFKHGEVFDIYMYALLREDL
ncbi:acyl-CoA N-acyltransferase [Echria macrotheca]|uniref:Acyl-CoA N-acyltransferase n=1 Tax=Echria macrotheca TaxID=438768 RepID=A0AAJ0B6B9_9PEZI|nr:acyl-CoA N-acyltransferase [Echria macrotheca]